MINLLTQPFLTAFFISFLTTPLVISFFHRQGWLEDPKKKKHPKVIHSYPVPRGGGIPIFIAITLTVFLFLTPDSHLWAILGAAFLALVVGLIDDIREVNPYGRFLTNILVALIIIFAGIGIRVITNPFGDVFHLDYPQISFTFLGQKREIWLLSDLFTLFWITWCMNIIGWSGGVEGQLPGFTSIAALIIGILSLRFSQDITQWPVVVLAGAVSGAYLGFLPFNFYPQKIMPGYSGKSLAGFFLAVLSILSGAKVATAILVLAVPMVDGAVSIIRRLTQGRSPFWGDAEHLHHLMLKMGIPKPKIAIIYWLFSTLLGMVVLNLNSKQKFWFLAMITALGGISLWWIRKLVDRSPKNNS